MCTSSHEPPFPSHCRYRAAYALLNEKIYVFGGFNKYDEFGVQHDAGSTMIYDIAKVPHCFSPDRMKQEMLYCPFNRQNLCEKYSTDTRSECGLPVTFL